MADNGINIINNQDDEDKDKEGSSPNSAPTPNNQAQAGSVYGSGGQGATPAGGAPKPSGTGFTNLSRMLAANQGNQLGATVGSGITNTVGQARQQIGQASNDFNTEAQGQLLDTDANKGVVSGTVGGLGVQGVNQYGSNNYFQPSAVGTGPNGSSQPVYNQPPAQQTYTDSTGAVANAAPNAYAPSDQLVNQFNTFRAGAYNGPTALADEGRLINQAQNAEALGKNAGTETGRLNLLQRFVGGKQYTQGEKSLDSLLLGQSAAPELNQARRDATGLGFYGQNQADIARQAAIDYANRNKEFGTQTKNILGETVGGEQTNLNNLTASEQARLQNEYGQFQGDLKSGQLTDEELAKTGLGEGQYLYGADLGSPQFLQAMNKTANAQNVASADDYAKVNALKQLGGQDYAGDKSSFLQGFTDPSQAGSFQKNKGTDFWSQNPNDLNSYISGLQNQVQTSQPYIQQQYREGEAEQAQGKLGGVTQSQQALQNAQNAYLAAQQRFQQASTSNPNDYMAALQAQQQALTARDASIQGMQGQLGTLGGSGYAAQALGLRPDWSGQGTAMNTADQNVDWFLNGANQYINQGNQFEQQKRDAAIAALNSMRGIQIQKKAPGDVSGSITGSNPYSSQ